MTNNQEEVKRTNIKKKKRKVYLLVIVFLLVLLFLKFSVFQLYIVPTNSMKQTVQPGDMVVANSLPYGLVIPRTPLSVPFAKSRFDSSIPFIGGKKSYVSSVQLPYYRLPGFSEVKRNDIVVFYSPSSDTITLEYGSAYTYYDLVRQAKQTTTQVAKKYVKENYTVVDLPVNYRPEFIKRCIALAGDTLEIVEGNVYVNGEKESLPNTVLLEYYLSLVDKEVNLESWLEDKEVIDYKVLGHLKNTALVYLNAATFEAFRENVEISEIFRVVRNNPMDFLNHENTYFPFDKTYQWNLDNYGPIYIPQKGVTVSLSPSNWPLYKRCVINYEGNTANWQNDSLFINNKYVSDYTFTMNYYWMMGDNRNQSLDSRFWGFVPEDHIKSKAMLK